MIAAMIFITPGAIRPAIATATTTVTTATTTVTTATKAATTANKVATTTINALVHLFQRFKDACRRLFGLNATSGVSVAASDSVSVSVFSTITVVATKSTDTPSIMTCAFSNANENDAVNPTLPVTIEDSNDEALCSDDDDLDDSVSTTFFPWLPRNVHVIGINERPNDVLVVLFNSTMSTWRINAKRDPYPMPDYPFFHWIPQQVLCRLATDALATTYFDMIHKDDKYAALSTDKKHAAIMLLNVLHLLNHRFPYKLDTEFAIVDMVVRVLFQSKYFVEAYHHVVKDWHLGYLIHRSMARIEERDGTKYPKRVEQRAALTNAFPTDRIE